MSGGGIWCEIGGVVSNCFITRNFASSGYGGGVYGGTIWHSTIFSNSAAQGGGSCSNILLKCVLGCNLANVGSLRNGGGAIYATLTNCMLVGNRAYDRGGAAISSTMTDCIISNNTAIYGGGAYLATLNNCTLVQNSADSEGGGAYQTVLNNCTLAGNSANFGGGASSNCTLISCLITNNSATYGGGVFSCALTNCVLANNKASIGGGALFGGTIDSSLLSGNSAQQGGGVCVGSINNVLYATIVNNCVISNNTALQGGGAAHYALSINNTVSPNTNCNFTDCTFIGNRATNYGGGAYACVLNRCFLTGNTATNGPSGLGWGGGVQGGILNDCYLSGNFAAAGGGADGSRPILQSVMNNCVFSNNVANSGGGAASCNLNNCLIISNSLSPWLSQPRGAGTYGGVLNNCLLIGNSATNTGCLGSASYGSALNNSTVIGNIAGTNSGAVINGTINNSIIYYNIGGNYGQASDSLALKYCCSMPLLTNGFNSTGKIYGFNNISNEPAFLNLSGGDCRLQSISPCINSGYNAYVVTNIDFDRNPRIVASMVDIGAFEHQTSSSVLSYAWAQQYGLPTDGSVDYVDLDGTGMNNWQKFIAGLNPTNPASVLNLQIPSTTNSTGITLTWQSVNTRTYYLQSSTNLSSFVSIRSNIVGQTGTTSYADTTATKDGPYFYRVGVQ